MTNESVVPKELHPYDFRLEKLKVFNPAVVYEFLPESTLACKSGSKLLKDARLATAGQYKDQLDAYLYTETILTEVSANLDMITPEIFLDWIKNINQRIGRTLFTENARGANPSKAGDYTKVITTRFKRGYEGLVMNEVANFLCRPRKSASPQDVARKMAMFGVDYNDSLNFITLLKQISIKMDDASVPTSQLAHMPDYKQAPNYFLAMTKLSIAYHSGILTAKERKIVDKVVRLGLLGTDIEKHMKAFAIETLEQLKQLDPKDITAVATCLSHIFQKFNTIHPFDNANKRTVICLSNTILCALDLPSISFYDLNKEHSPYLRAYAVLDENPSALAFVIKEKIEQELIQPYENLSQKHVVLNSLEIAAIISNIMTKFPMIDMKAKYDEIVDKIIDNYSKQYPSRQHMQQELAKMVTTEAAFNEVQMLLQFKKLQNDLLNTESFKALSTSASLNITSLEAVLTKFHELTGLDDWKKNTKTMKVWYTFANKEKAEGYYSYLKSISAMDVKLSQMATNSDLWVVMCDNINIKALMDYKVPFSLDEVKSASLSTSL